MNLWALRTMLKTWWWLLKRYALELGRRVSDCENICCRGLNLNLISVHGEYTDYVFYFYYIPLMRSEPDINDQILPTPAPDVTVDRTLVRGVKV